MITFILIAVAVPASADIELRGLLIDETRTFAGEAFYSAFTTLWPAYDIDGHYNLVISERPSAATGSQISVSHSGKVIYRQFVNFHEARARKSGQAAVPVVYERVVEAEVEQIFHDPDLAPDEYHLN